MRLTSRLRGFVRLFAAVYVLFLFTGFATQTAVAQEGPLNFVNNYFVTGDYVVRSVGLRGTGVLTGSTMLTNSYIPGNDANQPGGGQVPPGADIVEAFLYWQTVESSQTLNIGANGFFNGKAITGTSIQSPGAPPVAWSSGGCSGSSNGTKIIQTYRAGVRPLLNVDANGIVKANDNYLVQLPDSGSNGGGVPLTLGATLVLIYRVLNAPAAYPLSSVVIYDGAFSPSNSASTFSQTMHGFFQPSLSAPNAKLTHIVGNGQSNKLETVYLNGTALTSPYGSTAAAFPGAYLNAWDSTTFVNIDQYLNGPTNPVQTPPKEWSDTTSVTPNPTNSGCVTWGATIFKTAVQDSDNDGLLDVWEANQGYIDAVSTTDGINGTWVSLAGANSDPTKPRDLFVQLDYMCSIVNADGTCDTVNGHSHLPPPDVIQKVTNAYGTQGINLHLLPTNAILEQACQDNNNTNPPTLCAYPPYPGNNQAGVVSWRAGFSFLKNQPLNYATEALCEAATDCVRRFQHGRKDSYHYVIFGHSLGLPNWSLQEGTLTSVVVTNNVATFTTSSNLTLTTNDRVTISDAISNPALNGTFIPTSVSGNTFTIQLTNAPNATYTQSTDPYLAVYSSLAGTGSGMSDVGGQDSVITLGSWGPDGLVSNTISGTFFHELGHTMGLTHGGFYYDGGAGNYTPTIEPNCKSNYQSVMSYLFQVDLLDNGILDYSPQSLNSLNENSLPAIGVTAPSGTPKYATTQWYSPASPYGIGSIANAHCDGTPKQSNEVAYRMTGAVSPIDWFLGTVPANPDANFDGKTTTLRGYNDWQNLDLRQMGATGSNSVAGGVFYGGSGGVFYGGSGGVFYGGSGGVFYGGSGGVFYGGSGGVFYGGSGGITHGDLTFNAANSAVRPPRNLAASLTGSSPVVLTWDSPTFGQIKQYHVFRYSNLDTTTITEIAQVPFGTNTYSDSTVQGCTMYSYFVVSELAPSLIDPTAGGRMSVASNTATKTTPCVFIGYGSPLATAGATSSSGQFSLSKGLTVTWQLTTLSGTFRGYDYRVLNTLGYRFAGAPASNGKCPLPNAIPQGIDTVLYSAQTKNNPALTYATKKNQFVYAWTTNTMTAGCYILELDVPDNGAFRTSLKLQ